MTRALLAVVIAGSALAIGTAHTTILCVVAVVIGVACAFASFTESSLRARPVATLILAVGIGLTAFTALQAIPMPAAWVAAVAPNNADVWARALRPLQEPGPAWVTISLDPVATRVQVLRGVVYLLTFVTALRVAARRNGASFLAGTIVATGATLALAAVFHPLFGLRRVFGIYAPDAAVADRHISPLVNPNHLAGYLNVALCLALALAFRTRRTPLRVALFGTALGLAATQLWVASRGGVAVMFLAAPLVMVLCLAPRRRASWRRIAVSTAPIVLAAGMVAVVVLTMSSSAAAELASSDFSKLDLVRCALRLVPSHAWVGIGRGAFESTFPVVQSRVGYWDYTHPENIVAQWTSEWGVPVALAAAVALAYALRPQTVLGASSSVIGPWVAIAGTVVHNMADFSLEMPGVTIAITVCVAMVVSGTPAEQPSFLHRWASRPRGLGIALVAAGACAIAVASRGIGHELGEQRKSLLASTLDTSLTAEQFDALARDAALAHPADPYLAFLGAVHASRTQRPDTIAWAARALERSPIYGHAHFLIGRDLAKRSRAQARLEYRLAMEQDSSLMDLATRQGARLVGSFEDAKELVPDTRYASQVMELTAQLVRRRLPATSAALDKEISLRAPEDTRPLERRLQAIESDLEQGDAAPWCAADRVACARGGVALATRYEELAPRICAPHVFHARLLVAAGEPQEALALLRETANDVEDRSDCLKALARLARQLGDQDTAEATLERLSHTCMTDEECVANSVFVAQTEEARGNARLALLYYRRAAERAPARTDLRDHVAVLAARIGLPGEGPPVRPQGRRSTAEHGSSAFDVTTPHKP